MFFKEHGLHCFLKSTKHLSYFCQCKIYWNFIKVNKTNETGLGEGRALAPCAWGIAPQTLPSFPLYTVRESLNFLFRCLIYSNIQIIKAQSMLLAENVTILFYWFSVIRQRPVRDLKLCFMYRLPFVVCNKESLYCIVSRGISTLAQSIWGLTLVNAVEATYPTSESQSIPSDISSWCRYSS